MLIGVIGGEQADAEVGRLAFEVGQELGTRGHTLICGGRGGVMRESCRGAHAAGGLTVGILPGNDTSEANEFVDVPLATGLGFMRNSVIACSAQALIAIDGSYGTLSEMAFGLISGRPLIGLGTWELRDSKGAIPPIYRVSSAHEAVEECERAVTE
jgi:uncharacterized protein (TIGR00725 family)